MKKKILASLLAVCMFVGMAVPAFAISSQTAADEDITTGAFAEATYTIKKNATKPMKSELIAYAGTKKINQDPAVEWTIENDDKFAFSVNDDGVISAAEEAGTATLTAKMKDGKVVAKTKLVAAKPDADKVVANGFTFKSNTYSVLTGDKTTAAKSTEVVVIPTPANGYFTPAQYNAIAGKATDLKITVDGNDYIPTVPVIVNSEKVVFTYNVAAATPAVAHKFTVTLASVGGASAASFAFDGASVSIANGMTADAAVDAYILKHAELAPTATKYAVTKGTTGVLNFVAKTAGIAEALAAPATTPINGMTVAISAETAAANSIPGTGLATVKAAKTPAVTKNIEFKTDFPAPTPNDQNRKVSVKRAVSISTAEGVWATSMNASGTVKIEVGQKLDVAKYFKQGPSSSNLFYDIDYAQDYTDNNATYNDFAEIVSRDDGKCVIQGVAVGKNKIAASTSAGIATIVVEVVEKGTLPKPSDKKPTTPTYAKIVVGGTYKIAVKDAGTVVPAFTTLNAKVATVAADGTVKAVTAGTTVVKVVVGEDIIWVNVVVVAAPAVVAPDKKPTTPPQTGISLF